MTAVLTLIFVFLYTNKIGKNIGPKQSQFNKVQLHIETDQSNLKWELIKQYTFCLAAAPPEPGQIGLKIGSYVHLQRCDPNDLLQHFRYNKNTKQIIAKLKNKNGHLMCLDVYGLKSGGYIGSVQMYTCKTGNKHKNQEWEIKGKIAGKEKYRIVSKR